MTSASKELGSDLLTHWRGARADHPVLESSPEQRIQFIEQQVDLQSNVQSSHRRVTGGILGCTSENDPYLVDGHLEGGSSIALVGDAGSGRTLLLQELICDTLRRRGTIHALDSGYNNMHLCKALGGTHVIVEKMRPLGLNPFALCSAGAFTEVLLPLGVQVILEILCFYASDYRDDFKLESLSSALQTTWNQWGPETTFRKVLERISQGNDPLAAEACNAALTEWSLLGAWVDQADPDILAVFNQSLAVFEVEDIERKPLVHRVVSLLIAANSAIAQHTSTLESPKLFVVDNIDWPLRVPLQWPLMVHS